MFNTELRESIKRIAVAKMIQAESLISGSGQGAVKFEYVVNLILEEVKKLPLPVYVRVVLVLFQFAAKSELRREVQDLFDQFKDELHQKG